MFAAFAVTLLVQPAIAAPALGGAVATRRIESAALGETRTISIYRPPSAPSGPLPVVYLADGQSAQEVARLIEPEVAAGRLRPAIIVGLHSLGGERRARDHLVNFRDGGDAAFARHEAFLLKEVLPLAEREFGASTQPRERCVMGASDGAAWALSTALRNPGVFGCAGALSFGWSPAADFRDRPPLRLFLGAGRGEPDYLRTTQMASERARHGGHHVRFTTSAGGHDRRTWTELYPKAFAWMLR